MRTYYERGHWVAPSALMRGDIIQVGDFNQPPREWSTIEVVDFIECDGHALVETPSGQIVTFTKNAWVVGDTHDRETAVDHVEVATLDEREPVYVPYEEVSERVAALRAGKLGGPTHASPNITHFGWDITSTPKPSDTTAERLHTARQLRERAERLLSTLAVTR